MTHARELFGILLVTPARVSVHRLVGLGSEPKLGATPFPGSLGVSHRCQQQIVEKQLKYSEAIYPDSCEPPLCRFSAGGLDRTQDTTSTKRRHRNLGY